MGSFSDLTCSRICRAGYRSTTSLLEAAIENSTLEHPSNQGTDDQSSLFLSTLRLFLSSFLLLSSSGMSHHVLHSLPG